MEVKAVLKYSLYRKYLKDRNYNVVALKEGATIQDLINKLDISEYYLTRITVNDRDEKLDTTLSDGDTVVIWPPRIGGG